MTPTAVARQQHATAHSAHAPAPALRRHRSRRGDRSLQLFGPGHRGRLDRCRSPGAHAHRTSGPGAPGFIRGDPASRFRRSTGPGGVTRGGDDALQHLLGPIRPCPYRPRAGRRQLADPVLGGEARRRAADRARQHHASERRLALAVFQGEGLGRARPGRSGGSLRGPPTGHSLRWRRRAPQQHRLAAAPPAGLRRGRAGRLPDPRHPHRRPGAALRAQGSRAATTASPMPWAPSGRPSSNWSLRSGT